MQMESYKFPKTDKEVRKLRLTDYFSIPETIRQAMERTAVSIYHDFNGLGVRTQFSAVAFLLWHIQLDRHFLLHAG